jgi:HSP20 family protein
MQDIRSIRLRQLHGHLNQVVYEYTKVQFSQATAPEAWQPAVDAYRCRHAIAICIDLAGVEKSEIDLRVEPRRLIVRGRRTPPNPKEHGHEAVQVLVMEIDYGAFHREISFQTEVDPTRVTAEQRNGFLWVQLPLRHPA